MKLNDKYVVRSIFQDLNGLFDDRLCLHSISLQTHSAKDIMESVHIYTLSNHL